MPGSHASDASTPNNYLSTGLQGEFANWFNVVREEEKWLDDLFLDIPVDGRNVVEQGWYDVPLPGVWLRGQQPDEDDFAEFTQEFMVFDYKTPWLTWHIDDEQDDRSPRKFVDRVRDAAELLARYDEYALPELIAGAASTYLHPQQTFTCFTGSPLYSNAHSYGGQTLDNIVSGAGVATASNIVDDWYKVLKQFRGMVNSQGDLYWGTELLDRARFLILCSPDLEQVMDAAWKSTNIVHGAATDAESNYLPLRDKSRVIVWNRLSGNDWYVFLVQDHARPFVRAKRSMPQVREWNEGNSDWSRANNKRGLMWWSRLLYGPGNPFTTVKVDN